MTLQYFNKQIYLEAFGCNVTSFILTTIGNKTDIIDNDNHSISKSHIPGLVLLDLSEVTINGN